jgi:hypothetical protein
MESIDEKNRRTKISRYCPFKIASSAVILEAVSTNIKGFLKATGVDNISQISL